MKEFTNYTDDFKMSVIKEVLEGGLSKNQVRLRHGIKGKACIINWIRKFAPSQVHEMKKKRPSKIHPFSQLEAENKRLREELELERLRTLSLNVMIDIAEEQFNISIRKKSGAKQLKK